MRISLNILHYVLLNISAVVHSTLPLFGTLLIIYPIYHLITTMSKSTFIGFIQSYLKNDLFSFNNIPNESTLEMVNSKYHSSFSSNNDTSTMKLKPINTQICLLPKSPSELISGLTNTGNSCFLNSILQVKRNVYV